MADESTRLSRRGLFGAAIGAALSGAVSTPIAAQGETTEELILAEPWLNRLKALGGGVSLTGWRYLAGTPEQNGPPFRMIMTNGIHAGMSSDGMQIAPMNPWLHMYYATTGLNARQRLINGGQQITRQEALKLYTASNGWFLREEKQIGTIEPGKLADVVVLSDDYFTVPDEKLKKIRSVLTMVGGRIVHDAGL